MGNLPIQLEFTSVYMKSKPLESPIVKMCVLFTTLMYFFAVMYIFIILAYQLFIIPGFNKDLRLSIY